MPIDYKHPKYVLYIEQHFSFQKKLNIACHERKICTGNLSYKMKAS